MISLGYIIVSALWHPKLWGRQACTPNFRVQEHHRTACTPNNPLGIQYNPIETKGTLKTVNRKTMKFFQKKQRATTK